MHTLVLCAHAFLLVRFNNLLVLTNANTSKNISVMKIKAIFILPYLVIIHCFLFVWEIKH